MRVFLSKISTHVTSNSDFVLINRGLEMLHLNWFRFCLGSRLAEKEILVNNNIIADIILINSLTPPTYNVYSHKQISAVLLFHFQATNLGKGYKCVL